MQPLRGLLVLFAAARAELRVPSAPTDALLEIVGGDSVEVAWAPPLSDGGAAVRSRAESKILRPPRHRRDACSMAWPCRFLTARRSQRGQVIACTRHTR